MSRTHFVISGVVAIAFNLLLAAYPSSRLVLVAALISIFWFFVGGNLFVACWYGDNKPSGDDSRQRNDKGGDSSGNQTQRGSSGDKPGGDGCCGGKH